MSLNNPTHWKVRADEARVLAQALMSHPEAHAAMLRIAEEYDRLAVPAEQRINRSTDHTSDAK
jgi:hypothetical protein